MDVYSFYLTSFHVVDEEATPVSPSSVPLPETPAPATKASKNDAVNASEISDPSAEQAKMKEEQEQNDKQENPAEVGGSYAKPWSNENKIA